MIASGQEITQETRAEWLAQRRLTLGASEAGAALGLDPYRSPLELYLAKIGLGPAEEEPSEAAQWGLRLEPIIAQVYQERTGRRIAQQQLFLRSEVDPFSATLDAIDETGVPVEFKTISAFRAARALDRKDDAEEPELPPTWQTQAHLQMHLAGCDRVHFAVLVGGQRLRSFTVRRDEDLLVWMLSELRAFWGRVQERVPPPPTRAADAQAMARLFPEVEGEMELRGEAAVQAAAWHRLGETIRRLEEERGQLKAEVLAAMGPAASAWVPGLGLLRRRVVNVDAATVTYQRKASSYVDLRLKAGGNGDGQG